MSYIDVLKRKRREFRHIGAGGICAFTLVELLTSMTVLVIVMVVVFNIIQQTGSVWINTRAKIESFQAARSAFEDITQLLSHATLNTYYDYNSPVQPTRYFRQSDLHFLSGKHLVPNQVSASQAVFFQTPLGYSAQTQYSALNNALNACGFFLQYSQDQHQPAFFANLGANKPKNTYQFRLMAVVQPTENLAAYRDPNWYKDAVIKSENLHEIATNIIALIILPKLSDREQQVAPLTRDYEYDSRLNVTLTPQPVTANQMPPEIEVIMVALDEPSARRFENSPIAPPLVSPALFQDSFMVASDLIALEQSLAQQKLNYRVYRTTVVMSGSKWSY